MEFYQVTNNAGSALATSLDTTSLTCLTTSTYTLPTDTTAGYFYITIYDSTSLTTNEILTVTAVADHTSGGKTLTIQRAKQNTTAQSWDSGSPIGLNITADSIVELQDGINLLETYIYSNDSDISGIKAKTDYITVTQAVDLDTMESNITTNNSKVTFDTTASTKVGYISVTQPVDLDTIESNTTTNNAKISFDTTASTKVGYLTVTAPTDLDTIRTDTTVNNAKVSNATHTGEVVGSTSLALDPTAISGKSTVTPVTDDYLLLWDATDSLLKKVNASNFLGSGSGDVVGPASATNLAIAIFDSTTGKLLKNSAVIVDTSSNIVNSTSGLHLTKAGRYLTQTALSTSGSVSWNITDNPSANIILSGDVTSFTITGISINSEATLYIKQHASAAKAITFPGSVIWSGGYAPDLSTLNSVNIISMFSYDGTGLIASCINNTNRSVIENSGGTTLANAIAIFDSTSGGYIKDGAATLDVTGNIAGITSINATAISNYLTTDSTSTLTNKRTTMRVQSISDSTSISFNCDSYDVGKVTLAGNRVLAAPTGTPTNYQLFELQVAQDSTGSRTLTFVDTTSAGGYRINTDNTGITLSTAANKKDFLLFQYISDVTGWNFLAITKGL